MDKRPLIVVSICAVVLLVLGSLSNVVGMNTTETAIPDKSPVDSNEEIITFISGSYCGYKINKGGFIRDVEIWAGMGGTGLWVRGWKHNPLEHFGRDTLGIHAPRFIGIFISDGAPYGRVWGIAFGNIEWS